MMMQKIILFMLLVAVYSAFAQERKISLFDTATIQLSPIPINSPKSDFGASLIGDTLLFSSYHDGKGKKNFLQSNYQFYDLFFTRVDQKGDPTESRKNISEFSSFFHDGPVSFCSTTRELFLTRSNTLDPKLYFAAMDNENIKLSIAVARKIGNNWQVVEEFSFNNPKYSVGHPAISESGDTLIFSSDMPGGSGETDLFISVRKNGKWSKPANLGSGINSPLKDEFPFLTTDSTGSHYLIFSSNRKGGIGGLDLYYINLDNNQKSAIPFPRPINSSYDDFAMSLNMKKGYGYLSSNRPGAGEDDIYKITFKTPLTPKRTFFVFDNKSGNPIKGASIVVDTNKSLTTDQDGKIVYQPASLESSQVLASAFGYSDQSLLLSELNYSNHGESTDTIRLEMITNKNIVLKNIYYDFDSWEILPESAAELDKLAALMLDNPEMKVELGSHTDSRGTERYNRKLSQHRAQSAVNYILTKGIDADRITAIGYGESALLNPCPTRKSCSPAEQRENRRTEIFIPGYGKGINIVQNKGDYSPDSSKNPIRNNDPLRNIASYNTGNSSDDFYGYYLILGSFSSLENAENERKKLQNDNIPACILGNDAPFRVGLGVNDLKSARNLRNRFIAKFPDAWIY